MPFPKYYVTYCVMDTEAGANPFGHACLILSTQESEFGPIVVTNSMGFYSQPSTTKNPFMKGIKYLLGLNIDLQDGHGEIRQEKMRDIDLNGLHGKSFDITKEQFDKLEDLYKTEQAEEQAAIKQTEDELLAAKREPNGYTRFITEKKLAALEHRKPRLRPFHIELNFTSHGLDSTKSHSCKMRVLDLLQEAQIIDDSARKELEGGLAKRAFPRFSQKPLLPIRLVSTGEPTREESKSGRVFYNRTWKGGNRLFFASKLHLATEPTPSPKEQKTENQAFQSIRNVLTRIRQVENALLHAIATTRDRTRKATLQEQLLRVQKLYDNFAVSYQNHLPDCLIDRQQEAENHLNIATLSLTPARVNYSFAFRAYQSVIARHALLGFIGIAMAAVLLNGFIGAVALAGATCYTASKLHRFYQEEAQFAEMKKDYLFFMPSKPKSIGHSPETMSSPRSAENIGALERRSTVLSSM